MFYEFTIPLLKNISIFSIVLRTVEVELDRGILTCHVRAYIYDLYLLRVPDRFKLL